MINPFHIVSKSLLLYFRLMSQNCDGSTKAERPLTLLKVICPDKPLRTQVSVTQSQQTRHFHSQYQLFGQNHVCFDGGCREPTCQSKWSPFRAGLKPKRLRSSPRRRTNAFRRRSDGYPLLRDDYATKAVKSGGSERASGPTSQRHRVEDICAYARERLPVNRCHYSRATAPRHKFMETQIKLIDVGHYRREATFTGSKEKRSTRDPAEAPFPAGSEALGAKDASSGL